MKKAQISTEYLIVMGLLIFILIPLISYSIKQASYSTETAVADDVVKTIAKGADEIYALGPGSKKIVEINIPQNIISQSINNTEVEIIIKVNGLNVNYFAPTKGQVKGALPTQKGIKRIIISNIGDYVQIGEDDFAPNIISVTPNGTTVNNPITLAAITDEYSECKFSSSIFTSYSEGVLMSTTNTTVHKQDLTTLSSGSKTYYFLCQDLLSPPNTMDVSNQIQITFTVS